MTNQWYQKNKKIQPKKYRNRTQNCSKEACQKIMMVSLTNWQTSNLKDENHKKKIKLK